MKITVRRARLKDVGPMQGLHVAAVRETCKSHYGEEEIRAWCSRLQPQSYTRAIQQGNVFVAQIQGKVAGFGSLSVEAGEVVSLYVDPQYQRMGVGSRLLQKLQEEARAEGIRSLRLRSTLNAIGFYERAGYSKGEPTTYPITPEVRLSCVWMEKTFSYSGEISR